MPARKCSSFAERVIQDAQRDEVQVSLRLLLFGLPPRRCYAAFLDVPVPVALRAAARPKWMFARRLS